APATGQPVPAKTAPLDFSARFGPRGGCTAAIVDEIAAARQTVELAGRTLTSPRIADALTAAARRGVHVTVMLDAALATEHPQPVPNRPAEPLPLPPDARPDPTDNRVVLTDNRILITGSFDSSETAEEGNAANLLILRDQPQVQNLYEDNFRAHLAHSQPYDG